MWVFDFLAIWCLESLATESIHRSLFKSAGFSSELVGFRQLWWGDSPSPISHPVWTKVTGVGGLVVMEQLWLLCSPPLLPRQ